MNSSNPKTGILVANLGTPDSCSEEDVRKYLKEFLWDRRIVNAPRVIWWFVLNLIILNTRPKRSAAAYAKVWGDDGSPLLAISRKQAAALQEIISDNPVALGMRYGNPSISSAIEDLRSRGAERFVVLPMYPQYSYTTTASIDDALRMVLSADDYVLIEDYHDNRDYIAALAQSIRDAWQQDVKSERLLMSFHGIPQDYSNKGDPYRSQCERSARLLAQALNLDDKDWQMTFQSRLGPKQWLQPYTDKTLEAWGKAGVESVDVVCPGFSTDCLETLEEVAMENREYFIEAGGKNYRYIACLNDSSAHIKLMSSLVEKHLR